MQMVKRLLDALVFFICVFLRGEIDMVDMYVALVIAGRRTCNKENKKVKQVPANYRDLVLADLEAIGLDADGKPIE